MVRQRGEIDRWLIDRGVPHLIEDYAPTVDIWTRALPVLLVAYVAGGLNALDLREWSWERNLAAAAVVIVVLAAGWAVTNLLRHRRWFARPAVLGAPELAVFLLGPAVPAMIFGQWGDAFQAVLEGAAVLAIIYLGVSYGVVPLLGWAVRSSVRQVASLGRVVSRALPLLMLFTTFLFISAEVWQVAGSLTGPVYWLVLAVFFSLGSVFVLSRMPATVRRLGSFDDWRTVAALVADTPASAITLPSGRPPSPELRRRQRLNVGLVSAFNQGVLITFVALAIAAALVLLGFLAIPATTAASWIGTDSVHVLASVSFGGRELQLTEPLLRVAGFLAAFTGMNFTVVLSTDAIYREEFADDVEPQIRQALAVHLAVGAVRGPQRDG